MERDFTMIEWIKTWGVIGVFVTILIFCFQSCMTRQEINAKLDAASYPPE